MNKLIILLLMVLDCAIGATGAFFFKKASSKIKLKLSIKNIIDSIKNRNLIIGIIFYASGAALLTYVLKLGDLSFVYPLTSLTYIFTIILSVKLLKEKMNKYKWFAVILIIAGNIFITM